MPRPHPRSPLTPHHRARRRLKVVRDALKYAARTERRQPEPDPHLLDALERARYELGRLHDQVDELFDRSGGEEVDR